MAKKKTWAELTPSEKKAIYVGGAIELALTTVALVDLARREDDQVRGRKWAWLLSFVMQPFGPVAYFLYGRRSDT